VTTHAKQANIAVLHTGERGSTRRIPVWTMFGED
jgi:hypothetical protein